MLQALKETRARFEKRTCEKKTLEAIWNPIYLILLFILFPGAWSFGWWFTSLFSRLDSGPKSIHHFSEKKKYRLSYVIKKEEFNFSVWRLKNLCGKRELYRSRKIFMKERVGGGPMVQFLLPSKLFFLDSRPYPFKLSLWHYSWLVCSCVALYPYTYVPHLKIKLVESEGCFAPSFLRSYLQDWDYFPVVPLFFFFKKNTTFNQHINGHFRFASFNCRFLQINGK